MAAQGNRSWISKFPVYRHIKNEMVKHSEIRTATQTLVKLEIAAYIERNLFGNLKYSDSGRLARYEFSVFSQFGEDGAIREMFRRIGETNRFFVELGVGSGIENNTTYLLTRGWTGVWIEGNPKHAGEIRRIFADELNSRTLALHHVYVTSKNIEDELGKLAIPGEPDLLSIDVDYHTYWVWRGIERLRPRVVVVEYNAVFPPGDEWIVKCDDTGHWDGSSHMGASLTSLTQLAETKGYSLVGCSFAGSNAFFVRNDLVEGHFRDPFTAENHYEPPRYFLYTDPGHRRGWGSQSSSFVRHF